jgi:hypothetical protein
VVSLFALAGCVAPEDGGGGGPDGGIVLVTVEAFRADAASLYGGEVGMPRLERLAGLGTVFDDAVAATPMSRPSVASMLTGLAPDRTGVRSDVLDPLPPGTVTLAGRLGSAGWRTAAVVGSPFVSRTSGLQAGFELFDGPLAIEVGPPRYFPPVVPDDEVAGRFAAWIGSLAPDEPFFGWAHLAGLHNVSLDPADPRAEYDAALAATDRAIGTILDALEGAGRLADTVVVVVGTHGVLLGDDGAVGGSYWLRDESLRVPLVAKGPGFGVGERSGEPVWLPDLAPTLASLAGEALAENLDGAPIGTAPRRTRMAWTWAPDDEFAWPTLTAARSGDTWEVFDWDRLVDSGDSGKADPALGAARARPARPRVRELPDAIRERLEELEVVSEWVDSTSPELDDEGRSDFLARVREIQQLMAAGPGEGRRRTIRIKTRELVETYQWNLGTVTHRLFFLARRGGEERGMGVTQRALKQFPLRPDVLHWTAHIHFLEGEVERGEVLVEAAMAIAGPDADMLYDLACTRAVLGDVDSALTRLGEAVEAGFRNWEHIEQDLDLESVRSDPRYAELLRKHGR